MRSSIYACLLFSLVFILLIGCETDGKGTTEPYLEDPIIEEEEIIDDKGDEVKTIFIVDQTGKKWNITHAVNRYGFNPQNFQFGLGPNAIPPILSPEMIEPGQLGYPDKNSTFLVLGTRFDEDARAYPLEVMSRHEIVDEEFDDVYVAVAY